MIRARSPFRVAALAALLSLGACKTQTGRDFDAERIADIELDVTEPAQLEAWLGEPHRYAELRGEAGMTRVLFYQYAGSDDEGARGRTLGVEFSDELARGYLYDSSMERDSTDFDPSLVEQLVDGKSTRADVEALLGRPSGRFLLPSNLLAIDFGKELPDGTLEVWAWRSSVTTRSLAWLKTRTRTLALYFDAAGVLISSRYRSERDSE